MQTAANLLMIKPSGFAFNNETALSNAFQKQLKKLSPQAIHQLAVREFNDFVSKLTQHEIAVTLIEDTPLPSKPDAIFPNNWISSHENGQLFLYPMFAPSRRLERRKDILETIGKQFKIKTITDLSEYEQAGLFLEGTGSMILDRNNKIVYACISSRTNKQLLHHFANLINYETVIFYAADVNKKEIYHTNVMLSIGEDFAVLCSEVIRNQQERNLVIQQLEATHHEVIKITAAQMNAFAGNMLEVRNNKEERFLILSETAYRSLTSTQISKLEQHTQLLYVSIPTIETIGGGSARCMIAELFLPRIF